VHTGVVIGKEMTKAFYGKAHSKSYYLGCSTGGRQGFKAVQAFPEDFDGVVAGAPAFALIGLLSWSNSFYNVTGPIGSPSFVNASHWSMVQEDAMKQCDDGFVDGIMQNPLACNYDPKGLLCAPGVSTNCLTAPQVEAIRKIYSPYIGLNNRLIYPRLTPGGPYPAAVINGRPFPMAEDWYRYVVRSDPQFDLGKLTLEDVEAALQQNPANVQTFQADLSAFKARGAKVLSYHGHEDILISSANSARYYQLVRDTMKLEPAQLDEFYRLFMIPGMGHCGGGPGASMIGQGHTGVATEDPNGNVLKAIVRWVEEGIAPDTILGSKMVEGSKTEVKFQRKHCRFPRHPSYGGSGDPGEAESWTCIM
jgi:feruloyl esterase